MHSSTNHEKELFQALIAQTKSLRGFNAAEYIEQKVLRLNTFFKDNALDAAVIGISGGIDSAVAYSLLMEATKVSGSPIKKIQALLLPIHGIGTTNQEEATRKGMLLEKKDSIATFTVVDLSIVLDQYLKATKVPTPSAWSVGQLASIVRTPQLYFQAALLQQQGFKSIVVGTTNRDEGSYIGFFGKASDAMVDLQPIADLHKSEVYELAKLLNVPKEICEAIPSGDVWDGRPDEAMIGAPYWFLELYLLMKEFNLSFSTENTEAKNVFAIYRDAIEKIHEQNAHKYKVGNPAHFIDVMPRKIPGGWQPSTI